MPFILCFKFGTKVIPLLENKLNISYLLLVISAKGMRDTLLLLFWLKPWSS